MGINVSIAGRTSKEECDCHDMGTHSVNLYFEL
jgi:hypothetical protein